jgi:hypothetical protein
VPKEEHSADLHAQQATTAKRWRPLVVERSKVRRMPLSQPATFPDSCIYHHARGLSRRFSRRTNKSHQIPLMIQKPHLGALDLAREPILDV